MSEEATVTALPETFKGTAALADFKSVEALGEAFVNLKQYQGSSIRIPGEDAGEDQIKEFQGKLADVSGVMLKPDFTNDEQSAEFFRTLGRPEGADGYEFDPIEGFAPNEDKLNFFRQTALENNLTKAQAKSFAKKMMQQDFDANKAANEVFVGEVGKLKSEWGQAYEQNYSVASKIAKATEAPEAIIDAFEAGKASPDLVKWFHALSKRFEGEGQQLVQKIDDQNRIDTPDEIRGKISDIMDNREHPYYVATHPEHKAAMDKMIDLQRKLQLATKKAS